MAPDFTQIEWDDALAEECRFLVRRAYEEDLRGQEDWTTNLLVPKDAAGAADVVARQNGVVAGLPAAEIALAEFDGSASFIAKMSDGDEVAPGDVLATVSGSARSLLTAERTMLNLLGRLSGVATLTHLFVQEVAATQAQVYDTRKTTPGWRRLEKYAVGRGGGRNHRTGLYDAVLIKDNHLALGATGRVKYSPSDAVQIFRRELAAQDHPANGILVEVEVDTLDQLREVLTATPDIVLLDNMPPSDLREAVAIRDTHAPGVQLEASGGVNLETIRDIALTGVERISIGALTHSATCLDIGLDWAA